MIVTSILPIPWIKSFQQAPIKTVESWTRDVQMDFNLYIYTYTNDVWAKYERRKNIRPINRKTLLKQE